MPKIISTNFKRSAAAVIEPPYPQLLIELKDQLLKKETELKESRDFGRRMETVAKQETDRRNMMKVEFNGVEEFLRAKYRDQVIKHSEDITLLQIERSKVLSLRKMVECQETERAKNKDTVNKALAEVRELQVSIGIASTSAKEDHSKLACELDKARAETKVLRESVLAWTQLAGPTPTPAVAFKSGCICMICLDQVAADGVGLFDLGCGHLMCADCVPVWRAKTRRGKRICPICQEKTPHEPIRIYLQ